MTLLERCLRFVSKFYEAFTRKMPVVGIGMCGPGSGICLPRSIVGARRLFVGAGSWILPGSRIECVEIWQDQRFEPRIEIGENVYIGRHFFAACVGKIKIADNCVLSDHVYISDCNHSYDKRYGHIMKRPLESRGGVTIGEGTFIGYRVVIMPGVTIGRDCVVGAQSVVTKSIPDGSTAAGVPARIIPKP